MGVKQKYNQDTEGLSQVGDRVPAEWEPVPDRGLGPSVTHGWAAQPECERSAATVRRTWGQYVAVCLRLQLTSHTQPTSTLSRIKCCERYILIKKCVRSFIEVHHYVWVCFRNIVVYSYITIDRTLSSATTPSQSRPESNGNEAVLRIPQSSSITGTSPSNCFVSYPGHSLQGVLSLCRETVGVFYSPSSGCKYECISMCVCMCVPIYVYMYVCMYLWIYIYMWVHKKRSRRYLFVCLFIVSCACTARNPLSECGIVFQWHIKRDDWSIPVIQVWYLEFSFSYMDCRYSGWGVPIYSMLVGRWPHRRVHPPFVMYCFFFSFWETSYPPHQTELVGAPV